jgi:hypothetical protein
MMNRNLGTLCFPRILLGITLLLASLYGCSTIDDQADSRQGWHTDEMGVLRTGSISLSDELGLVASDLTRAMIPMLSSGKNMRYPVRPAPQAPPPLVILVDIDNRSGRHIEDHCTVIQAIRKVFREKSRMTVFPDVLPPERAPVPLHQMAEKSLDWETETSFPTNLPQHAVLHLYLGASLAADAATDVIEEYREPVLPQSCGILAPQIPGATRKTPSVQLEQPIAIDAGKSQRILPSKTQAVSETSVSRISAGGVVLAPVSTVRSMSAQIARDASAKTIASPPASSAMPAIPATATAEQLPAPLLPLQTQAHQQRQEDILRFVRERERLVQGATAQPRASLADAKTIYLVKSIFTPNNQFSLIVIDVRSDTIKWASIHDFGRKYRTDTFYTPQDSQQNQASRRLPNTIDTAVDLADKMVTIKEGVSAAKDLNEIIKK